MAADYSCFNCDSLGGGMYKQHDGDTEWFIGHADGQGHYACRECSVLLYDALPIDIGSGS